MFHKLTISVICRLRQCQWLKKYTYLKGPMPWPSGSSLLPLIPGPIASTLLYKYFPLLLYHPLLSFLSAITFPSICQKILRLSLNLLPMWSLPYSLTGKEAHHPLISFVSIWYCLVPTLLSREPRQDLNHFWTF